MRLNINTNAAVIFANKLEKIGRSALPVAVRGALNDTAFDVKTKTMPAEASGEFTQRQKNFFTANSKFEYAKGFDINTMRSTVGFYENKLSNAADNYAVKDLEQQEHGGAIGGKSFIPTVYARKGNAYSGMVRPNARLKAIRAKGIIDAGTIKGKYHKLTKQQQFIAAAKQAREQGGKFVLYAKFLYKINDVVGKAVDATPLYSVKHGRSVNVGRTQFMRAASLTSAKKMESFYIARAKKALAKFYNA